jgi:hypothetical protein
MEEKDLTPTDYFDYVKKNKRTTDSKQLQEFKENALYLLDKYQKTNQIAGMKKLMFIINSIGKEERAIENGINQFVYRDDIEDFIGNVASNVVKIIDLPSYPREIPDDIVTEFEKVKDIFDVFYVVFTDYTGQAEKQVEKKRRDKDPILFGAFHDKEHKTLSEKFYYIGDWIDEYCDLTLEKMVTEMRNEGREIVHPVGIPESLDELRKELESYTYVRGEYIRVHNTALPVKKGFIQTIKSWFTSK